jgi:thymidine kinase
MFSGKTEELIKQVKRAQFGKQKCQAFKPIIDARYSVSDVCSHDQTLLKSHPVKEAREILQLIEVDTTVVAIDEGQFFDESLLEVVEALASSGKRVLISGLDTDWKGRPFGPMPKLMALAEIVRKQYAVCMCCGGEATRTQRLTPAQEDIVVGSTEAYEARCRAHFDPGLSLRMRPELSVVMERHETLPPHPEL